MNEINHYAAINDENVAVNEEMFPQGEFGYFYPEEEECPDPELWLYRERTAALLRRYLRLSIEVGRLPSILGRKLFRAKVTSYRMSSFEDAVIFVYDVERALERLQDLHKQIIAMLIFQEYTQEDAAEALRCGRRTITREYATAIDCITRIFLDGSLLTPLPERPVEKICQEGGNVCFPVSACEQGE